MNHDDEANNKRHTTVEETREHPIRPRDLDIRHLVERNSLRVFALPSEST